MGQTVNAEDLAKSFGVTVESLPVECLQLLKDLDFSYRHPTEPERDKIILEALKKVETDTQIIGAPERKEIWQSGWEENLNKFVESGNDLETLVPHFIRPGLPIRFNGNYILPANEMFELAYLRLFRLWLARTYFHAVDTVYEFGCGTGFNLVEIARLFPKKSYVGLDFVPASAELIEKIGKAYGWRFEGRLYDFRNPDKSLEIAKNSAVFTFGALEQVANDYKLFVEHMIEQRAGLCINIEPTLELYDRENLFDYLAIRFHTKRGYTSNYLTYLRQLESQGRIEILKTKRLYFGSMFMEGYTYMVWKPL